MAMLNNQRGYLPSRTTYTENPSAVLAPLLARSMAVFMASWGSTTRISSAKFMAMPSWAQGFCDFFWPKTWFCLEEKDRKKWGSWFFFWGFAPWWKNWQENFLGEWSMFGKDLEVRCWGFPSTAPRWPWEWSWGSNLILQLNTDGNSVPKKSNWKFVPQIMTF